MKLIHILQKVRPYWPDEITITDALRNDGGIVFSELSKVWDQVELEAESRNDDWLDVAVYAFFCALHNMAEKSLDAGLNKIVVDEIDLSVFRGHLERNIADPSWSKLQKEGIQ